MFTGLGLILNNYTRNGKSFVGLFINLIDVLFSVFIKVVQIQRIMFLQKIFFRQLIYPFVLTQKVI